MGNVLIIKNNDINSKIHCYAQESYDLDEKRFYNTMDGTVNAESLKEIKANFGENGIVLMISYESSESNQIKDVFIGSDVNINDKDNIEYIMKVYLNGEQNCRTIESIIDKMDLDISKDFGVGCYVIMSDMESLFQELQERIMAKNRVPLFEGKMIAIN